LDVGGGLGVFAYGFQEYFSGWKSLVVEPTPGSSEIAETHGVNVHELYLDEESHQTIGKNFDLITANHVVEHVDHPVEFLMLLKQYLSETGLICIEMPSTLDIGFLEINHDRFMSQHEVIYNNETVEILAKKASLRVISNENYISKRGRNNVRAILSK
jgi:2-polyprenyl-3-methyl-5-hydroxy-6-metoxy-1,4-benzoquinol methylase